MPTLTKGQTATLQLSEGQSIIVYPSGAAQISTRGSSGAQLQDPQTITSTTVVGPFQESGQVSIYSVGTTKYTERNTAPFSLDYLMNSSGARLGCVGNSLLNFATTFLSVAAGATDGKVLLEQKSAVSGATSAAMLAQVPNVPITCNSVAFMEGTNDAAASVTITDHISNMKAVANAISGRGFVPVLIACPTRETTVSTINSYWLPERVLAEDIGIPYVDPWSRYIDTDGSWVAGATSDGDHPTSATMTQVGLDMADLITTGKTGYLLPRSNSLGEGLFSNALLLSDGDANGRPDGWSRLTVTGENFSLAAATHPARGNKCTVVVSQTVNAEVYRTTGATGWSVGDTLRVSGMISLASMSNCNFRCYVRVVASTNVDVVPFIRQSNCSDTYFQCEVVMPTGATDLQVWFEASSISGAAYTCTFGFSGVNIYNISTARV